MFATLAAVIDKPPEREWRKNLWIRPGTWVTVNESGSKRGAQAELEDQAFVAGGQGGAGATGGIDHYPTLDKGQEEGVVEVCQEVVQAGGGAPLQALPPLHGPPDQEAIGAVARRELSKDPIPCNTALSPL